MSGRQVRIIFGVLAALILVWAGKELLGGRGDGGPSLGMAAAVDSTVTSVRIVPPGGGDTVHVALDGDGARVNGFPADSGAVRRLLRSLDTLRTTRMVARNPDNHAALGVTEDAARRVEVGGPSARRFTLLVGDRGRGGRYVRSADSDRVFVLEGRAVDLLTRDADRWRLRRIARVDTARLDRIELVRETEGDSTVLERTADGWTLAGGAPADSAAVANLLGALSPLRASGDFPSDSARAAADFGEPDATIRLHSGTGGPSLTLRFVERGTDGWLVRRDDRPWIHPYSSRSFELLFPSRGELAAGDGGDAG